MDRTILGPETKSFPSVSGWFFKQADTCKGYKGTEGYNFGIFFVFWTRKNCDGTIMDQKKGGRALGVWYDKSVMLKVNHLLLLCTSAVLGSF